MSSLPKPALRGHVKRAGVKCLIGAITVGAMSGLSYHFLVANPARERYRQWLETYDGEAHSRDLMKWGYFKRNEE